MSSNYAYIRVSSKEQNEYLQIDAISKLNILDKNIFVNKQSGQDFNRTQYIKLLKKLSSKDTVYIKSIDKLGRSYDEILEQCHIITEIKANIVVFDTPLINNTVQDS